MLVNPAGRDKLNSIEFEKRPLTLIASCLKVISHYQTQTMNWYTLGIIDVIRELLTVPPFFFSAILSQLLLVVLPSYHPVSVVPVVLFSSQKLKTSQ